MRGVTSLSATNFHALALNGSSSVICFGNIQYGECPSPSLTGGRIYNATLLYPNSVYPIGQLLAKNAFADSSLFVANNTLYSAGNNYLGLLGTGDQVPRAVPLPLGISNVKIASVGNLHSLVLTTSGTVFGFGYNAVRPSQLTFRMVNLGLEVRAYLC